MPDNTDIRLLKFAIQHASLMLGIVERAKHADDLRPSIVLIDAGAEAFTALVATDAGLRDPFTAHLNRANLDIANRISERLVRLQGTPSPG